MKYPNHPIIKTGNRLSDRSVRAKMQELTGLDRGWAKLACRATVKAIQSLLLEGRSVNLWRFGSFHFRLRTGRTINMSVPSKGGGRKRQMLVQADRVLVKFKQSPHLAVKLKHLQPDQVEHLQMPKRAPIHYTPKPPTP